MFKTLSAALIAASVMLAPMAVSANAAQPAKPVATKQVKMVKTHRRFVVRHHKRAKFAKHARHFKRLAAHKRAHVATVKPRTRAN
jgi:Ni/Co efflux regulator RcnB